MEVVDRYTVKFHLKEPFVWLLDILASPICMWIIAPEVVQQYGDLKKVGDRHWHRTVPTWSVMSRT